MKFHRSRPNILGNTVTPTPWRFWGLLLLSGILCSLATAPMGWTWTAWITLIPLWRWGMKPVWFPRTRWLRQQLLAAIAWGGGFYGGALFWITGIHPMTWLGVPWLASLAVAIFCWSAITGWGIILVFLWLLGLAAWQHSLTRGRDKLTPKQVGLIQAGQLLWGTASWCGLEALWSHSILWWSPLAYTQSPSQLALLQWLRFSGTSSITAAIMLVNGLLTLMVFSPEKSKILLRWRYGIIAGLLWLCLYSGGYWQYHRPLTELPSSAIRVGLIQGNIGNDIKFNTAGWRLAIAGYQQGYESLVNQGAAVVLTPEGAFPYLWETMIRNSSFYQAILRLEVPVWLGAYARKHDGYTNSLLSIDAQGQLLGRYDKVQLVPLGEYIPLSAVLGQVIQRLSPLKEQLLPGDRPQALPTEFGLAAVTICYESAFPHLLRQQLRQGAEFILSSANNAHYSATMPAQHHGLDVMRAIEGERWLARATNTGLSAIISPTGETHWLSLLDQYQIHLDTIYRRQTQTPFVRWGDWLTPLLLGGSGLIWLRLQKEGVESS